MVLSKDKRRILIISGIMVDVIIHIVTYIKQYLGTKLLWIGIKVRLLVRRVVKWNYREILLVVIFLSLLFQKLLEHEIFILIFEIGLVMCFLITKSSFHKIVLSLACRKLFAHLGIASFNRFWCFVLYSVLWVLVTF